MRFCKNIPWNGQKRRDISIYYKNKKFWRQKNVTDLELDVCTGKIIALMIPAENGKMFQLFSGRQEYYILWKCVKKIGDDIILIEGCTEEFLQ